MDYKYQMEYCTVKAYSRRGMKREKNEDACGIAETFLFGKNKNSMELRVGTPTLPILITLADGMGGHDRGAVASQTVVQHLSNLFYRNKENFKIDTAIKSAHKNVIDLGPQNQNPRAMGTTLVGAILFEDMCHIFNVGDSRAYLLTNSTLKQLSTDDVYPGQLNSAITQCIGGSKASNPRPHMLKQEIQSREQLIFVSDGITDAVNDDILRDLLLDQDPEKGEEICNKAADLGGGDDASIIICEFY